MAERGDYFLGNSLAAYNAFCSAQTVLGTGRLCYFSLCGYVCVRSWNYIVALCMRGISGAYVIGITLVNAGSLRRTFRDPVVTERWNCYI